MKDYALITEIKEIQAQKPGEFYRIAVSLMGADAIRFESDGTFRNELLEKCRIHAQECNIHVVILAELENGITKLLATVMPVLH